MHGSTLTDLAFLQVCLVPLADVQVALGARGRPISSVASLPPFRWTSQPPARSRLVSQGKKRTTRTTSAKKRRGRRERRWLNARPAHVAGLHHASSTARSGIFAASACGLTTTTTCASSWRFTALMGRTPLRARALEGILRSRAKGGGENQVIAGALGARSRPHCAGCGRWGPTSCPRTCRVSGCCPGGAGLSAEGTSLANACLCCR